MLVLLLLVFPIRAHSQHLDLSLRAFPSSWYNTYFEPGLDGGGLAVSWHPELNSKWQLNISGEFSVLRMRNETLLGLGINRTLFTFYNKKGTAGEAGKGQAATPVRFRISIDGNLLNGISLYQPSPLYVGGAEAAVRFDYHLSRRIALFASIGARATFCPGYRDFGIWRYNSWPLAIGIRL